MLLRELEALIRSGAELSGWGIMTATIHRHSHRWRQTGCTSWALTEVSLGSI